MSGCTCTHKCRMTASYGRKFVETMARPFACEIAQRTISSAGLSRNSAFALAMSIVISDSHVPIPAQLLERVLAFLVLGATGALGGFGVAQFLDDVAHGFCVRLDWKRAGRAAQAAITFTLAVRKVERDNRNVFALDVFPDIQLRPVQQGMDANVRALFKVRLELVPQFGGLVLHVPFHVFVARTEIAFLGARGFFIAANA